MSTPFIKYRPDIEAADPRFDETLQSVIAKTERYIAGSVTTEGAGRAVRDAHAKGYGLVRAEVEILDRLPAEYAQGIYAKPRRHDALIRFSNGSPHAGADARQQPVSPGVDDRVSASGVARAVGCRQIGRPRRCLGAVDWEILCTLV